MCVRYKNNQNILITPLHKINFVSKVHFPLVKWRGKKKSFKLYKLTLSPFSSSPFKVEMNICGPCYRHACEKSDVGKE